MMPNNPFGIAAQRRRYGNGGCLPRKHAGIGAAVGVNEQGQLFCEYKKNPYTILSNPQLFLHHGL